MKVGRKVSYKAPYKKRAVKRNKVVKPSKTLVKQVQSIIAKNVEDKAAYIEAGAVLYNSVITTSGDIRFILPDVSQGVQEGNRIGDQLSAKRLTLNGLINMNLTFGGSTNATRLGVRVFIVQPKLYMDRASITANANSWLPYLLRKGNSASAFNGTVGDLYAPVNSETVTTYYDKVHYLSIPYMLTQAGQQETAFSYRHFNKVFNLKGKKFLYDSNYSAGQYPTNFSPVILIGYAHLDGSTADTVNTQISLSFTSLLDYEDA